MGTVSAPPIAYNGMTAPNPNGFNQASNGTWAVPGPVDIFVQQPQAGIQQGGTPSVMIRQRQPNSLTAMPYALPQVGGVPYASTVPMAPVNPAFFTQATQPGLLQAMQAGLIPSSQVGSSLEMQDILAPIPPPDLAAPYAYSALPPHLRNTRQEVIPFPATTQNFFYYPPTYPGYGPPPATTAGQWPQQQQQPLPGQNPALSALTRQDQAAQLPKPPADNARSTLPDDLPIPTARPKIDRNSLLTLNDRLQGPNKAAGAIDFYKLLESNPELSYPDSPYKSKMDSLMVKLLKDPEPAVRNAAWLAFETNSYFSPSSEVIGWIQKRVADGCKDYEEPKTAQTILSRIKAGEFEPQGPYPRADVAQGKAAPVFSGGIPVDVPMGNGPGNMAGNRQVFNVVESSEPHHAEETRRLDVMSA